MKLLFVLDTVEYPLAPNPQLARRVAECLAGQGHTVMLLELWDGQTPPPAAPAGCTAMQAAFPEERRMNAALEYGRSGGTPTARRLARLAADPAALLAALRQIGLHRPRRQTECRRLLETLDAAQHFDAVVTVNAPYYSALALAEAKIGGKKALWQMDPYAICSYDTPAARRAKEALYAAVDRCFITRLMQAEFDAPEMAPFAAKAQVLDFPCLIPPPAVPAPPRPTGSRSLTFVGSVHPVVRPPQTALDWLAALNRPDLTVEFVGGGWEGFAPAVTEKARAVLGERLIFTGPLPPAQARQKLAGADLLLSLGNTTADQLPSKIFDYFGTGKPVLHIACRPDDPALPYLAQYSQALVLHRGDPQAPDKLNAWLALPPAPSLPFAQVEALFPQNTPAAVARALLHGLEERS